MNTPTIKEQFAFLLQDGRFDRVTERQGPSFREAHFYSPSLVLRVAEQQELIPTHEACTCLCFLVDPENENRWCMFEAAVGELLGRRLNGTTNLTALANNVETFIDRILSMNRSGRSIPFGDFSEWK